VAPKKKTSPTGKAFADSPRRKSDPTRNKEEKKNPKKRGSKAGDRGKKDAFFNDGGKSASDA